MNELERSLVKINFETMDKKQLINGIKHKLKYIPLNLEMLELAMIEQEKIKQISATDELAKDLELLSIMSDALKRKCKIYLNDQFVQLNNIHSTTESPIVEHDPEKLPHEFDGASPSDRIEITVREL